MENNYNLAKSWLERRCHRTINSKHQDFPVLSKFLKRHPNYKDWKYQEPICFKITRNTQKSLQVFVKFEGTKRFRIVSWVACAKGGKRKNATDANKLNQAMRHAIRSQIKKYKREHPYRLCYLCGSSSRIEVDHHPKHFCDLRDDFIQMKKKRGDAPPVDFGYHPKKGRFIFKNGNKSNNYYDQRWKMSWQRYHNKYASYRYLCSTCNKKNK